MLVSELFDIKYGINLELDALERSDDADAVNFVARTSENNGVVARVKRIPGKEPQPAGILTCASGGRVLSTFVQNKPFYSGRDLYLLIPKKEMSLEEKLFYCHAIKMNAYRYSYGRQANKTLKNINLPPVPSWLKKYVVDFTPIMTKIKHTDLPLDTTKWKTFTISTLFDISLASGDLQKNDLQTQGAPLVSATTNNNGIIGKVSDGTDNDSNKFTGNQLTTDMFCNSFYQGKDFYAVSHGRVNIMKPKFKLNKYIGMFISTIINKEQYRFAYGRAVYSSVLGNLVIKLPVASDGNPDWKYMEKYIKSLPYSDLI